MIRIFLTVFGSFFKIGLFTLGGGLAIITLVQQEMFARGWLTQKEFLDILGIAQSTPGAMGVNTATFTGWRVALANGGSFVSAFLLAAVATAAVMAPSVVGVGVAGGWFERHREKDWMKAIFSVLRPIVAGFIFTAGANMVLSVFGAEGESGAKCIRYLEDLQFHWLSAILCAGTFALTITKRFSPLLGLLAALVCGIAVSAVQALS
ncbi:MAG: chromate transporter [Kiritimatiellae bacterium]|nr:chromate transporter [Kiritimatiellia bacterium]